MSTTTMVSFIFKWSINFMCVLYVTSDTPTYGEFNLQVESFVYCKGPKRKDCAVSTPTIKENSVINIEMLLPANFQLSKGKIVVMSNGKKLLRLQVDNPCNHLFLWPLIQSMLNATENCIIKKGFYKIDVDLEKIAKNYYQGAFIYGEYSFKALFYNDDCNLSCTDVTVKFCPKNIT